VQPPGKSVTDAVVELLREVGCDIYFGPEPLLNVAWEIGLIIGGRSFRAGVNPVNDYNFYILNPSWVDRILGRRPRVYLDLLQAFSDKVRSDPRFSNVRWYPDKSMEDASAARDPVEMR
jgi:hypothetical protein